MRALARLHLLAALVVGLGGCAWLPQHITGPSCESLDRDFAGTIAATRQRPAGDDILIVPVVIHVMTDSKDTEERWPEKDWKADKKFDRYFGVGNLSVNAAWAAAAIHFEIQRVELCSYTPPPGTFRPPTLGVKGIFAPDFLTLRTKPPAQQPVIIDHYLQLNATYGVPRALNVYLWAKIDGAANGYGESPRRGRIEVTERGLQALPTVWFESWTRCGTLPPDMDACQIGLAHEFGHALGLSHTCRLCDCPVDLCWVPRDYHYVCSDVSGGSQQWKDWRPCEGTPTSDAVQGVNTCGEAFDCCAAGQEGRRLMYPKATEEEAAGKTLCPREVQSARSAVQEFFY